MYTIKTYKERKLNIDDDIPFNKQEHTIWVYNLIKHLKKVYEDIEELDAETMWSYSNLKYYKREDQRRLYNFKRDFEKGIHKEYTEEESKSILEDIDAVLNYDEEFEY